MEIKQSDFDKWADIIDRTIQLNKDSHDVVAKAGDVLRRAERETTPTTETLAKRLREAGVGKRNDLQAAGRIEVADLMAKQERRDVVTKATMTTGDNLTGRVIPEDRRGVMRPPERITHVRPLLASDTTTRGTVSYIEETGFTQQAAGVPEGDVKPESELSFTERTRSVEVIADTMRVTRQMLEDVDFLAAYIDSRMREGIRIEEDDQLLYGNGNPGNLTGITTDGLSAFDNTDLQAAISAGDVTFPQRLDVLRYAILQARKAQFVVDTALLSPVDIAAMDSLKDEDGRYLDEMQRLGVRIAEIDAVAPDNFIVGSMASGGVVQLLQREAPTLRFFEQDRDNVPKNVVTIRVEERLVVATYRPEGIVTGTFTGALSSGT